MSPFSILRRSPRGRKWNEQQNSRDDVKSPIGTLLRDDIEHDDTDDAETTANSKGRRGGFNKDLLYNLRNRLTGKRTTSQSQPQQEAAAVRAMSSFSLSLTFSLFLLASTPGHILAHPSLPVCTAAICCRNCLDSTATVPALRWHSVTMAASGVVSRWQSRIQGVNRGVWGVKVASQAQPVELRSRTKTLQARKVGLGPRLGRSRPPPLSVVTPGTTPRDHPAAASPTPTLPLHQSRSDWMTGSQTRQDRPLLFPESPEFPFQDNPPLFHCHIVALSYSPNLPALCSA